MSGRDKYLREIERDYEMDPLERAWRLDRLGFPHGLNISTGRESILKAHETVFDPAGVFKPGFRFNPWQLSFVVLYYTTLNSRFPHSLHSTIMKNLSSNSPRYRFDSRYLLDRTCYLVTPQV